MATVIREFVDLYFDCRDCRSHFLMAAREEKLVEVRTRRELVMWLWRVHNMASMRIGLLEIEQKPDSAGHDPAFPKHQFPSEALCHQCRSGASVGTGPMASVLWKEDNVFSFLMQFYGSNARMALTADTTRGHAASTKKHDHGDL